MYVISIHHALITSHFLYIYIKYIYVCLYEALRNRMDHLLTDLNGENID